MEKTKEEELRENTQQSEDMLQLPVNFVAVGEPGHDEVKVYIRQEVYRGLEKYAHTDTTKELGCILLGTHSSEGGHISVVISEFIEARYTDASVSTLTFTHETWDYIHSERDSRFPELKIVGWQHTHPDHGIFLSGYDMFIEENFFDLPFQVAYVIDPVQGERGFFAWKNGRVEKLGGFYVFDDVGKEIKLPRPPRGSRERAAAGASHRAVTVLSLLLTLVAVAGAVAFITLYNGLRDQRQRQEELGSDVQQLQDTLAEPIAEGVTLGEMIERIESQQVVVDEQEEVLENLRALLEDAIDQGNLVVYTSYTVQPGDSLYTICLAHGISYHGNARTILALNGIKNEDLISVGQVLILPLTDDAG